MLRHHHRCYGAAPDGRLFRGSRGGPLSESSYGRTWHSARTLALGPAAATPLARRPYDLRHAALSLWLNSGAAPAEIARRAGHSVSTLLAVYTYCIDGQDHITNRQIEGALHARSQAHHHSKRSGEPPVSPKILSAICPWMARTRAAERPPPAARTCGHNSRP